MSVRAPLIFVLMLSGCSTFGSDAGSGVGVVPRRMVSGDGWQRSTYIYDLAAISTSGLPADLVTRRRTDALLEDCKTANIAAPRDRAVGAFLPIIMFFFNVVTGEIDRALKAKEKQRLASLSDQFAVNAPLNSFPLQTSGPASCVVIDDVELNGSNLRDRATYVMRFRPVGTTAFVIEPFGVRISRSDIIKANMTEELNVDLALSMTTVTETNGKMPALYGYPAYSVSFSNVEIGKTYSPAGSRSIVLPLPQDSNSPTSLVAAVTESHVTLSRETERVTLQQETRKALIEALGEMLKTKLGG